MEEATRDRWREIARTFSSPFRAAAERIVAHESDDFEMLWLLADFAQICVKVPALVVLAECRSDQAAQRAVFEVLGPQELRRPTFGQWLGFLRFAIKRLRNQHYRSPLIAKQKAYSNALSKVEHDILPDRNWLAHGAMGRFEVTPEEVEKQSKNVLEVARGFQDLFTREFASDGGKILLRFDDDQKTIELFPFVLAPPSPHEHDEPWLYAELTKQGAVYFSSAGTLKNADLGKFIDEYLREGTLAFPLAHPQTIDGDALIERSGALVRKLQMHVNADYFSTDRHFSLLPSFAGRPRWARQFIEVLAEAPNPLTYHVYGRRGSGKRKLLADLCGELVQQGHVVAPVLLTGPMTDPVDSWFNRALRLDGCLKDLEAATMQMGEEQRLVLVLGDFAQLLTDAPLREQLGETFFRSGRWAGTHLVLMSDSTEPVQLPWTTGAGFVQVRIPRMEQESCAEFYERITAKPKHAPLVDWEFLPDEAHHLLEVPVDLVSFCEKYDGRDLPADFSIPSDLQDTWDTCLAAGGDKSRRADAALRQAIVGEMGSYLLASGRREVPESECPTLRNDSKEAMRAREQLEQLSIIAKVAMPRDGDYVTGFGFTSYDWLVRALLQVLGLPKPAGQLADDVLHKVLDQCDRFGPVCDALAVWAADLVGEAPETFASIFVRVIARRPRTQNKLVETLLVRAYPNEALFNRLVLTAIESASEPVFRGCAAAAQQVAQSAPGAEYEAAGIYQQLLQACGLHGFERLEAVLLNEFAQHGLDPSDLTTQREYFLRAIEKAQRLKLDELEHVAQNNWARVAMLACQPPYVQVPDQVAQTAERVIGQLVGRCEMVADDENWQRSSYSHQLIAEAYTLASGTGSHRSEPHFERAIEICRKFGGPADMALALDRYAGYRADRGEFSQSLPLHDAAVDWMRIAGDGAGEATAAANRGLTRVMQSDVDDMHRDPARHAALKDYRHAKRILRRMPRHPQTSLHRGRLWENMARLFERMNQIDRAIASARQSGEYFEDAQRHEDAERMWQYLGYLER